MKLIEGIASIGVVDPVAGATHFETVEDFVTHLGAIGEETGCAIQPFDARRVVDAAHLRTSVEHANRAVARGTAVADDRAVEILCYTAGRRQINQAMDLGVGTGHVPVVIVVDDGTLGTPPSEGVSTEGDEATAAERVRDCIAVEPTLETTDESAIRTFFDISDVELAATDASLSLLVQERVALLDIEK